MKSRPLCLQQESFLDRAPSFFRSLRIFNLRLAQLHVITYLLFGIKLKNFIRNCAGLVFLAASLVFLTGCATEMKMWAKLKSMEGRPVDEIVDYWGPPEDQKTFEMNNGDKVYTWVKRGFWNGWCKITVTSDKAGMVDHFKFEGHDCTSAKDTF